MKNRVGSNSVEIATINSCLGSINNLNPTRTSLEMPSLVRNRDLVLASSGRSERNIEGIRSIRRLFRLPSVFVFFLNLPNSPTTLLDLTLHWALEGDGFGVG